MNISFIEASIKILMKWYHVPTKLAKIFLDTSPCASEGVLKKKCVCNYVLTNMRINKVASMKLKKSLESV